MEKTTRTNSQPRALKGYTDAKTSEGRRFSTPSEYIRSLARDDQDRTGTSGLAAFVRPGICLVHGSEEKPQTGYKK